MARTKPPAKTAKPTPTPARKPRKVAPDAPSMEAVSPPDRDQGGVRPGSGETGGQPTPEQVYCLIQEIAYFKAKARNFAPGHEVQDWIEAEAEVRRRVESRA